MPHYQWQGLDLQGNRKKGTRFAENTEQLAHDLLQEGVALLAATTTHHHCNPIHFLNSQKRVSQQDLIAFFDYTATLLTSGIPLHKALTLVTAQVTNPTFATINESLCHIVEKGASLSSAMKPYQPPFQPFMIQLIETGENTATLAPTFAKLADHLKKQCAFTKTIKQAALLPSITLLLAAGIMLLIFIFVIPQFETFFVSMNKELPAITTIILKISSFLRNNFILLMTGFIVLIVFLWYYLPKTTKVSINLKEKLLLKVPYINNLVYHINLIRTLQGLSLLLKSGLPIKQSLELLVTTTAFSYHRSKLTMALNNIMHGQKLSQVLELTPEKTYQEILSTFLHLGEQTGALTDMLEKVILIFEEKLQKKLTMFLTLFQPVLLVIVGLIIAIIMAAIYLPLFNMANLFNQ